MIELLLFNFSKLPAQLVVVYTYTKLLQIEDRRVYFCVSAALIVLLDVLRGFVPVDHLLLYFLLSSAAVFVFLPLAASEGVLSRRIIIAAFVCLYSIMAEISVESIWALLFDDFLVGINAMTEQPVIFALLRLLLFGLVSALCTLLVAYNNRRSSEDLGDFFYNFIGFPITQVACLGVFLGIGRQLPLIDPSAYIDSKVLYSGSLILCIMFLISSIIVFVLLDKYREKVREERLLIALQQQLDASMEHSDRIVNDIEETAKFRHDMRNQLQVAELLAASGQIDKAREQIGLMAKDLEDYREGRYE